MADGELQHTLALGPSGFSFSTLSLTALTLTLKLHYGIFSTSSSHSLSVFGARPFPAA